MTPGCVVVNTFKRCRTGVIRACSAVENSVFPGRATHAAPVRLVTLRALPTNLIQRRELAQHIGPRGGVPALAARLGLIENGPVRQRRQHR